MKLVKIWRELHSGGKALSREAWTYRDEDGYVRSKRAYYRACDVAFEAKAVAKDGRILALECVKHDSCVGAFLTGADIYADDWFILGELEQGLPFNK